MWVPPSTAGLGRRVASRPTLDPLAHTSLQPESSWLTWANTYGSCQNTVPHVFHTRCPQMTRGPRRWAEGGRPAWCICSPTGQAQSGTVWWPRPPSTGSRQLCVHHRCANGKARRAWLQQGRSATGPLGWPVYSRHVCRRLRTAGQSRPVCPQWQGCAHVQAGYRHQPLSDKYGASVSHGSQTQCGPEFRAGPSGPVLPLPRDPGPPPFTILEHEQRPVWWSHGARSSELPSGRPTTDLLTCVPPPPWVLLGQEYFWG